MARDSYRTYNEQSTATPQIVFDLTSTNGMMLICNIIMAVVIIVAMLRDQYSTTAAVIVAAVYFLGATFFIAVVMSGTLTNIIVNGQREKTERRKWDVLEDHGRNIPQVELPQLADKQSADFMQSPNYVPAADESVRRKAAAWLLTLYGADGFPDPNQVILDPTDKTPAGRIRTKMPDKPVIEYLISKRLLFQVTDARGHVNGYRLRLGTLPHRNKLAELDL